MKFSAARRSRTFFESPWPWLAVGVFGTLLLVAVGYGVGAGYLRLGGSGPGLYGTTILGLMAGVVAVLCCVVAGVYSLRKRSLQERLPVLRGSVLTWLWVHVVVGAVAVPAALVHGGAQLLSLRPTSGTVVFWTLAILVASGVLWRFLYRVIPPLAQPRVGNYSQEGTHERAAERLVEIEKLAAGKSLAFQTAKAWLLRMPRPKPAELAGVFHSLPPAEQGEFEELRRLAGSRHRALGRARSQTRFTWWLQGSRLVHIPLTLVFVVALGVHLVAALHLPERLLLASHEKSVRSPEFHASTECASCHQTIYDQWASSMHAHAMTSPMTVVQTNQDLTRTALGSAPSPDPREICVNCHGPLGALLTAQADLPLGSAVLGTKPLLNEGISCAVCHQYVGTPVSGGGGLARRFQADLRPTSTYFAGIANPVANPAHQSGTLPLFRNSEAICTNCHNVNYDRNGDGRIAKGVDLVLQTTYDEYETYRSTGGKETCLSCHMPLLRATRVAEAAMIPFEQAAAAPPRAVHDHSFVGVDYPLDQPGNQRAAREALLRNSAQMQLDPATIIQSSGSLTFAVRVANVGVGHNLPSGFAFSRQMWLEVKILDGGGNVLASSGLLANSTDDLCDAGTMDEAGSTLRGQLVGCGKSDPQLVNWQQKLVDEVNGAGQATGKEASHQHLAGGVVSRIRPSDRQLLDPLKPSEAQTFAYQFALPKAIAGDVTIGLRLLFRHLPPYSVRVLGSGQTYFDAGPELMSLVGNIQTLTMAKENLKLAARGK